MMLTGWTTIQRRRDKEERVIKAVIRLCGDTGEGFKARMVSHALDSLNLDGDVDKAIEIGRKAINKEWV